MTAPIPGATAWMPYTPPEHEAAATPMAAVRGLIAMIDQVAQAG
jgi:hypothetical protein